MLSQGEEIKSGHQIVNLLIHLVHLAQGGPCSPPSPTIVQYANFATSTTIWEWSFQRGEIGGLHPEDYLNHQAVQFFFIHLHFKGQLPE